jgi:type II secretory pathway component PulC
MNSYFTKRLVMYFSVRENLIASAGFLLVAVVVLVGCYAWLAPESARPFVAVADVTQTQSADNLAMAPVTATPVIIEEKKLPVTAAAQRLLISATPLAIVLVGIVDSNDASLARAVIEFRGQQQLYGVGAKLPMGDKVFVKNVLVDRVIIENNGQLDTVFMYVGDAARGKYNTPTGSTPTAPMTPAHQYYAAHEHYRASIA